MQNAEVGRFKQLFNGRDLEGWTARPGNEGTWTVENGIMRGVAQPGWGTWIATNREFGDFRLRMEVFSHDNINKHIFFRSSGTEQDGTNYRFNTGGTVVNGDVWPWGKFTFQRRGSRYDGKLFDDEAILPPTPANLFPLSMHTWHRIEITAQGNIFRMTVNNQEVSECQDTQSSLARGRIEIAFRAGARLDIRNIEILEPDSGRDGTASAANPTAKAGSSPAPKKTRRSRRAGKVGITHVRQEQSPRCASARNGLDRRTHPCPRRETGDSAFPRDVQGHRA